MLVGVLVGVLVGGTGVLVGWLVGKDCVGVGSRVSVGVLVIWGEASDGGVVGVAVAVSTVGCVRLGVRPKGVGVGTWAGGAVASAIMPKQ